MKAPATAQTPATVRRVIRLLASSVWPEHHDYSALEAELQKEEEADGAAKKQKSEADEM